MKLSLLLSAIILFSCAYNIPLRTKDRVAGENAQETKEAGESAKPEKQSKPMSEKTDESLETPFGTIVEEGLAKKWSKDEIVKYCHKELSGLPGEKSDPDKLRAVCNQVEVFDSCSSQNGHPIFHYDRLARDKSKEKRILTIALIHGDEGPSGSVASSWMQRLERLDPRNHWRVIPIANPDGFKKKSRQNINGVDLNRNFPTGDWQNSALKHWKEKKNSDPRKYPGPGPASEKETKCLVDHMEDFDPHFIISIHTPYGVLDFDGPRMNFPSFHPLPWISLGNYPGSLGRYMWVDKKIPVLTIELKGAQGIDRLERFDRLQDISGTVAIQSNKIIEAQDKKKTNN